MPSFDPGPFDSVVQRCRQAGVVVTTLGASATPLSTAGALYELNRKCPADIPGRGAFYSFSEYVQQRLAVPFFDPTGVVLAVDEAAWVGLAASSDQRGAG